MSSRQVVCQVVVCDGCSVEYDIRTSPIARTRELAAREGWRHKLVPHEKFNWARAMDYCPRCEVQE